MNIPTASLIVWNESVFVRNQKVTHTTDSSLRASIGPLGGGMLLSLGPLPKSTISLDREELSEKWEVIDFSLLALYLCVSSSRVWKPDNPVIPPRCLPLILSLLVPNWCIVSLIGKKSPYFHPSKRRKFRCKHTHSSRSSNIHISLFFLYHSSVWCCSWAVLLTPRGKS